MISRKMLCGVLGVVLFWGLSGCGGSEEPSAPSPAKPAAPEAKAPPTDAPAAQTAPAESDKSNVVVTNTVPDGFPSDVPEYPGANVLQGRAAGDSSLSMRFETGDSADQVVKFYNDALVEEKWSTEVRQAVGGTAIFADKGSRRLAISVATGDADKTRVDIIVAESPF